MPTAPSQARPGVTALTGGHRAAAPASQSRQSALWRCSRWLCGMPSCCHVTPGTAASFPSMLNSSCTPVHIADIYTDLGDFEKAAQYYGAPIGGWSLLLSCSASPLLGKGFTTGLPLRPVVHPPKKSVSKRPLPCPYDKLQTSTSGRWTTQWSDVLGAAIGECGCFSAGAGARPFLPQAFSFRLWVCSI